MDLLRQIVWTVFHLTPDNVNALAQVLGGWLYLLLFVVIFAETGLVVVPFLPGDSLLFLVGVLTALSPAPIGFWSTALLLSVAAVLGDAVNYLIGARVGPAVFSREDSRLLNKKHLNEAHAFYETYGGKTIILARFIPIIRTFAPFVAGIGKMNYARFALYNVAGGVAWVVLCLAAGRTFSEYEFVQKRFELVIIAIVAISVLPAVIEFLRARFKRRGGGGGGDAGHAPVAHGSLEVTAAAADEVG
jgi:membrane-associated protein